MWRTPSRSNQTIDVTGLSSGRWRHNIWTIASLGVTSLIATKLDASLLMKPMQQ